MKKNKIIGVVVAVLTAVMLMVMALLLCGIYLAGGDKSSVVLIVIMTVFLVPAYIYMVKKMYNMDEEKWNKQVERFKQSGCDLF